MSIHTPYADLVICQQNPSLNLDFLNGKEIVGIGAANPIQCSYEENTLIIDYKTAGVVSDPEINPTKRVVIEGNDLGYWIAWNGIVGVNNEEDLLRKSIEEVWGELTSQEIRVYGDPAKLMFLFVAPNDNNKLVFGLKMRELLLIGNPIRSSLTRPPYDSAKIVKELGEWCFQTGG